MHVVSLLLLLQIDISFYLLMAGLALVSGSAFISLQQVAASNPVLSLQRGDLESLKVYIDGTWQNVDICRAFITAPLLAIRIRLSNGKQYSYVYFHDSLQSADFRQLKIFLLRLTA